MDRVVSQFSEHDRALLKRIGAGLPVTADVSRSDLRLWCLAREGLILIAHAQPRSISSLYPAGQEGQLVPPSEQPLILRALREGKAGSSQHDLPSGTPVVQAVYPVRSDQGKTIACLSVETNLIAHERHRRRHRSFQRAVRWLQGMAVRGELQSAAPLSPFGEWDGILYVDSQRRIAYLSGIANNLYRRLGYLLDLRGTLLADLQTGDEQLVRVAVETGRCQEEERQEGHRLWNRKVVPLRPWEPTTSRRWRLPWEVSPSQVVGALVMVRDLTDERLREKELRLKATMVQEVHHRVKNNLQAVASLLRMQSRRLQHQEGRQALDEAVGRILSVAVIHEFLSQAEDQLINIRDVCQRIIAQLQAVAIAPDRDIQLEVRGPSIYLPSRQATACALVVNELLENALEHGCRGRRAGAVVVRLHDGGDEVSIGVHDEEGQLPKGFDVESESGLGLRIVRMLVEEELRGQFELRAGTGVSAVMVFPKRSPLS
jgi:two-component sensor histidine kinase